ncbi:MAG: hypothetical protein KatS3mg085_132 [Candidatus Dojkabacteria bacterium]|nr:MAG: hypothetical protein KatS3mg085_132 [Candidatus Dojkabacteria bacterium]
MERYPRFKFLFVGSSLVFFLLLILDLTLANIFLSFSFFFSLFYLIFRFEPPIESHVEVPPVDYYRRSRFNSFNYFLILYSIVVSLIFGILSVNFQKALGFYSFLAWLGMIGWIELLKKIFTDDKVEMNLLADYLIDRINDKTGKRLAKDEAFEIIKNYEEKRNISSKILKKFGIETKLKTILIKWIEDYKQSQQQPFLRGEIDEIK